MFEDEESQIPQYTHNDLLRAEDAAFARGQRTPMSYTNGHMTPEEVALYEAQRKNRRAEERRAADLKAVRDSSIHRDLCDLMREAAVAQPFRAHTPDGATQPTAYTSAPMKRSLVAPLRTTNLLGLFDKNGNIANTPTGALAGEVITLSGGIVANSRVAKAGAHVILRAESSNVFQVGKTPDAVAIERLPARFVNIDAASFATVAEDDDAPSVALASVVRAADLTADWGAAKMKAFSMELKRSDLHRVKEDELLAEVMTAITLGVARAADEVLLSAITAATPNVFSLAALAARGLQLGDVRALAGTSATGAAVGADGVLRVAGVPAGLTPDMAGTLIGAWNRVAVAVNDEVTVIFERVDPNGRLALSVWATMLPVIPDPSVFWTVAA